MEIFGDVMCSGLEHISNCIDQLVNSLVDLEKSRKNLERVCIKKHELAFQLDSAKMPLVENEKTEDELDGEKNELGSKNTFILNSLSNEKVTELENELKEQEVLLSQERVNHKELEAKCAKLRYELDGTIKHCKKLNSESCNLKVLLKNHLKGLEEETTEYRHKIVKLESEVKDLKNDQELNSVELIKGCKNKMKVETKETQTLSLVLITSSTNTEREETKVEAVGEGTRSFAEEPKSVKLPILPNPYIIESLNSENLSSEKLGTESKGNESFPIEMRILNENVKPDTYWTSQNLGVWEKIQKIQQFLSDQPSDKSSQSHTEFVEMKNLVNLITEDLVHLLLREQQISKDKQSLQEKLDKSMTRNVSSNFELVNASLTLLTAVILCSLWVSSHYSKSGDLRNEY